MNLRLATTYETARRFYLTDSPAIETTLKSWLDALDLDTSGAAFAKSLEAIECRSRDGFIPNCNNRGGFDLVYRADLASCFGGGNGPDLGEIDAQGEAEIKCAAEEFSRKHAEELSDLGIANDNVTYKALCDVGAYSLAEQLDELERDYMREIVSWGARVIYHGPDAAGMHSLTLFVSGNVSEYYNAFGRGSEDKYEADIEFTDATELLVKLTVIRPDVEGAI